MDLLTNLCLQNTIYSKTYFLGFLNYLLMDVKPVRYITSKDLEAPCGRKPATQPRGMRGKKLTKITNR